jgi:hypothetical protein
LVVLHQLTLRSVKTNHLQPFDTTFLVLAQVLAERILRDAQDPRNPTVRQALALQQQCLHLTLDTRMRMVESLVAEFVNHFFREFDLDHWALLAEPRTKAMPLSMRPVRQSTRACRVARRANQVHARALPSSLNGHFVAADRKSFRAVQ